MVGTNPTTNLKPFDLCTIQTKEFGYNYDSCVVCNRSVDYQNRIAISPQDFCAYDPELLDTEEGDALELGEAYVGPECMKKIPSEYIIGAKKSTPKETTVHEPTDCCNAQDLRSLYQRGPKSEGAKFRKVGHICQGCGDVVASPLNS